MAAVTMDIAGRSAQAAHRRAWKAAKAAKAANLPGHRGLAAFNRVGRLQRRQRLQATVGIRTVAAFGHLVPVLGWRYMVSGNDRVGTVAVARDGARARRPRTPRVPSIVGIGGVA